jgi:hypothetical protein
MISASKRCIWNACRRLFWSSTHRPSARVLVCPRVLHALAYVSERIFGRSCRRVVYCLPPATKDSDSLSCSHFLRLWPCSSCFSFSLCFSSALPSSIVSFCVAPLSANLRQVSFVRYKFNCHTLALVLYFFFIPYLINHLT